MLLLLVLVPFVQGLAIVSKTDFSSPVVVKTIDDADTSESNSDEKVELYLLSARRRNNTRNFVPLRMVKVRFPSSNIEKRKESTSKVVKGKEVEAETRVPIVRGAAAPTRNAELTLPSSNIEGLRPPSEYASGGWSPSGNLETNTKYPDSNGYYPDVGDGSQRPNYPPPVYGPPSQYPPPVYGPPTSSPNPWGCQAPGYPDAPYPPSNSKPQYPPSNSKPQYPPSNYPQYPNYPQTPNHYPSNYPNSQYPSNYPNTRYPSQNQYPSNQKPNSHYPNSNQYPSNQYPSGYPPQNNWNTGNQWKNSGPISKWVPCKPYDLTNRGRGETRGCPESESLSSPPATPTSKIDDKMLLNELPRDVEEFNP